jgi:hypothetical protein
MAEENGMAIGKVESAQKKYAKDDLDRGAPFTHNPAWSGGVV